METESMTPDTTRDAGADLRADLIARIHGIIKAQGLTQRDAAGLVGMTQPRLNALLRGQYSNVSTDLLFRTLNRLGYDVRVSIAPQRGSEPGLKIDT